MKWFVKCIRNYVNFSGRARRREYWNFVLFSILLMLVALILDWICFGQSSLFYGLAGLFLFLPNLAVMSRRLHDTGRSAKILIWYYVLGIVWSIALVISGASVILSGSGSMSVGFLVLLVGGSLVFFVWGIVFLVWFCTAGTPGENQYGPDPKQIEA